MASARVCAEAEHERSVGAGRAGARDLGAGDHAEQRRRRGCSRSRRWWPRCAALILRPGAPIEPDVSTITISAASGWPAWPAGAVGGDGHDRVDLRCRRAGGTRSGRPRRERAHRMLLQAADGSMSTTATVMLSWPPRSFAVSASARATAAGAAPSGSASTSRASSSALGRVVPQPVGAEHEAARRARDGGSRYGAAARGRRDRPSG